MKKLSRKLKISLRLSLLPSMDSVSRATSNCYTLWQNCSLFSQFLVQLSLICTSQMVRSRPLVSYKILLGCQLATFKVQDRCVSPLLRVSDLPHKNSSAPKERFIVLSTLDQLLHHKLEILVILFNT